MNLIPRLLALFAFVGSLAAQVASPEEAELTRKATSVLTDFARVAMANKLAPRAKQAYDQILLHYDGENRNARQALGFKKVGDKWEELPPEKRPKWVDKATYEQRFKIVDEWHKTAVKLAALHRTLGLQLLKGDTPARGTYHLERAIYFNPIDKEAHLALGHTEINGFYDTEQNVAFIKRMKEIEVKAIELAKQDYPVEALPLESLPAELKALELEFHGSRSKHFTIWTRGTQENADNCVKWSERGFDFLSWLVGEQQVKRAQFDQRMRRFSWFGFVWTSDEREKFLVANPHIYAGKTIEEAKAFANVSWRAKEGPAMVLMKLTPAQMHDTMIAWVAQLAICDDRNDSLGEGLKAALTWYLQSTSITQFGAPPEGTGSDRELKLPESTSWWQRAIRDQATAGVDWPINQVPRERLSRYRNDVRMKSWSFMTWVLAAYPDKWLDFYSKCPKDKIPFPEEIDKVGEEAFGKPLAHVEAEWREWARGDSVVAAATGYGPPLLPERPNAQEIAVLERMNQVRGQALAYTIPEGKKDMREGSVGPLPPCELDAEASMACEDHSVYLTKWTEEHLKWPEAHEENPAREGFSPRGMRAGMRSVIVFLNADGGTEFAKDSVDGWLGTPYHRFPLLVQNIKRFGYSFVYDNGYSIATLDMGSLQEPYDPVTAPKFVAWPPPNMKEVPRRFHGIEHPNPLGDQPPDQQDLTKTGYPISLQLQTEYAGQMSDAHIRVYRVNTGAKGPGKYCVAKGDSDFNDWVKRRAEQIPTFDHTPMKPLLKRTEEREVIFCIPKEILADGKRYQVEVRMVTNNELYFIWEFETGSQMEGLKLK